MYVETGGQELAKVLWYYGLIGSFSNGKENIMCPFHEDINPSMAVDYEKGSYFCFGCEASGDALKFVQQMENKLHRANDLKGCYKYFKILKSKKCNKVHIPKYERVKKPSKVLYAEAYDYYHGLSKVDWCSNCEDEDFLQAKQYMQQRGFLPSTLNKCMAKVNYNASYGIIFPMLDNGKFKGWVCRTMIKQIEEKRKYLYNEGFSKKLTLIGDYSNAKVLFIVEGYMDRLKFIQYGVDNVVAILGWHISEYQREQIERSQVQIIVSALDNDKCGKKGSSYLQSIFKDRYVRFSYLKGIKDPGEMSEGDFKRMYSRTMKKVSLTLEQLSSSSKSAKKS